MYHMQYEMCAITTNSIEVPSHRRSVLWPARGEHSKKANIVERASTIGMPARFFQDNMLN